MYLFFCILRCSMFFNVSVSNNYRLVDLQIFIKFLIQRTQMEFFQQMYNFDYVVWIIMLSNRFFYFYFSNKVNTKLASWELYAVHVITYSFTFSFVKCEINYTFYRIMLSCTYHSLTTIFKRTLPMFSCFLT